MINTKVLGMVKTVAIKATKPSMTKREEPVTIEEINDLLDDVIADEADEIDVDEVNDVEDVSEIASEIAIEEINENNEQNAPIEDANIEESDKEESNDSSNDPASKIGDKIKSASDKIDKIESESIDFITKMRDALYPISTDTTCSVCCKPILENEIIQFNKHGLVHHSACNHADNEMELIIFNPTTESVSIFGESCPVSMLTENKLCLAKINSEINPSLKNAISVSRFICNYGKYVEKLNNADIKNSILAKDDKSNIVKLTDVKDAK